MEDRILINGVWYVRETEPKTETKEIEVIDFIGSICETDDYVWKASRLYKDDGETFYDGFDIEFTDKTTLPWKEEHWHNMNWFKGVLEDNPESMKDAIRSMDDEGIKDFKLFLNKLKDKGW
jgi:hypothetical protein